MVKATIMSDATTADPGDHNPKGTSTTPGQTEASFQLWGGNGMSTGIWEVTPGTFTGKRDGQNEVCQILSGSATITEANGNIFEVGPGSLFVTPSGWAGIWTIHETLRKMWVLQDIPPTST